MVCVYNYNFVLPPNCFQSFSFFKIVIVFSLIVVRARMGIRVKFRVRIRVRVRANLKQVPIKLMSAFA